MSRRMVSLLWVFVVVCAARLALAGYGDNPKNLATNPRLEFASEDLLTPAGYKLVGDTAWTRVGNRDEFAGRGVALHAASDVNRDGKHEGSISHDVREFPRGRGQWFRFSIRGLAQDGFTLPAQDLHLKVEFYSDGGKSYLDCVTRKIFSLVEQDRADIAVNGQHRRGGAAVWKTYALEFMLPFAEIDQLRLIVGFRKGKSTAQQDAFWVDEFSLVSMPAPQTAKKSDTDNTDAAKADAAPPPPVDRDALVSLGGRWMHLPVSDATGATLARVSGISAGPTFDYRNADRLFYDDGRLGNPFAENMSAWVRAGYLDRQGAIVPADRFLPDNVTVRFEDKFFVVEAHNIPNHPTARFPETPGPGGGNPSYIQEKLYTYFLPLEPRRNPKAIAMDAKNSNWALPGGPIGIAINGVVFYNPFDAGGMDASNIVDRCCGHPSPDNRYHYHKYPVCVKSPFSDEGKAHSPLIGWAFDGFPIYGPYESDGVMAKDSKDNPLNAFNIHHDDTRGWHYHVTPGKFPYIIGGWWGEVDPRNKLNNELRRPGGYGGLPPGVAPLGPPPTSKPPGE